MKRTKGMFILEVLVFAVLIGTASASSDGLSKDYAVGVVFHDANHNGVRDVGEKGLEGIRVSNGRSITRTDAAGLYRLPVSQDTIVFVIKPRDWMPPLDRNNLPLFYYIHKPKGSPKLKYSGVAPTGPLPESVDFPLYPQQELDRFSVVLFGDTHVLSKEDAGYLARDVVAELADRTDAVFGLTMGDIVFDDLSFFDMVNSVISRIGIPWYNVKGNHDTNFDARPNHQYADETFESVYGPSYYSFDYGPVHFVVLHNQYFGLNSKSYTYTNELDFTQMSFLRRDLALVPRDQLVVLLMHTPIIQAEDRLKIYRLLETHPNTISISAHYHTQRHVFITAKDGWNAPEPHHHLILGASCGPWWRGMLDEVGIPHATMSDGTPNGYSIITFDNDKYSIRLKAARRPDDYQMNIFAPDEVSAADSEKTEVLVNVFAGSERSVVEMQLANGGNWIQMERVERTDPYYVLRRKAEEKIMPPDIWAHLLVPSTCYHMWKANLPEDAPAGTHLLRIRTTDMFGQIYTACRVITITRK